MNKTRIKCSTWSVIIGLAIFTMKVPAQDVNDSIEIDSIPLNPEVRNGKLENGFTYYIQRGEFPQGKVVIQLAIKAGSIREDDNQIGLAHLLEHMAFRGTTHFPNDDYLGSFGIRKGFGMSGSTEDDATIYTVTIPSNDAELLKLALQVARDWAQELLLDPKKVDIERGVVIGELQQSMGMEQRTLDEYGLLLLGNSTYAQRKSRGRKEVIESTRNFRHKALERFYKDWYRPDLQALVVVGDIETDEIETKIHTLFGDLKRERHSRKIEKHRLKLNGNNQFLVVKDKELSTVNIQFHMKRPGFTRKTRADYKVSIIEELYNLMMKARFSECLMQYNPPFEFANSFSNKLSTVPGAELSAISTYITTDNLDDIKVAFQAAMTELRRVDKFGFTKEELTKAIDVVSKNYSPKKSIDFRILSDTYIRHFLSGRAAPSDVLESAIVKRICETIGLEDVNGQVSEWINNTNCDFIILAPENLATTIPDEAVCFNWLNEIDTFDIKPYAEKKDVRIDSVLSLIRLPKLSSQNAYKRITHPEIGVIRLELWNGVNIVLKSFKPMDSKSKRVLLKGFRYGGATAYSGDDYSAAFLAAKIIKNSGVCFLDKFELERSLEGKTVELSPYIDELWEGIEGYSSIQDIETMLQLVFAYFTLPHRNAVAFEDFMSDFRRKLEKKRFATPDPEQTFLDTIYSVIAARKEIDHTSETLSRVTLDKIFWIYNRCFSNVNGFTFVLTGDFNLDETIPLILKYIGALPGSNRHAFSNSLAKRIPKTAVYKTVYADTEADKASVRMYFTCSYEANAVNDLTLDILKQVLEYRLITRLREKEGGTYWVFINSQLSRVPNNRCTLSIMFICDPSNVERLVTVSLEEIELLKEKKTDEKLLQTFKEQNLKKNQSNLLNNGFWLDYLTECCKNDIAFQELLDRPVFLKIITPEMIMYAAKQYLAKENILCFTLLPKAAR